jgi:hypothetical protein
MSVTGKALYWWPVTIESILPGINLSAERAAQQSPGRGCEAAEALGFAVPPFQRCGFRDSQFMSRPRSKGSGPLSIQLLQATSVALGQPYDI